MARAAVRRHTVPVDQRCLMLLHLHCVPRFLQDFLVNKKKLGRQAELPFQPSPIGLPGGKFARIIRFSSDMFKALFA